MQTLSGRGDSFAMIAIKSSETWRRFSEASVFTDTMHSPLTAMTLTIEFAETSILAEASIPSAWVTDVILG